MADALEATSTWQFEDVTIACVAIAEVALNQLDWLSKVVKVHNIELQAGLFSPSIYSGIS